MLRSLIAAAALFALPSFADEDPTRTPATDFAAEATVTSVRIQPADEDGVDWMLITLKVKRCIAGACAPHQLITAQVPVSQWRNHHGETVGLVRYAWKGARADDKSWYLPIRLDDADQKDRFERECEVAVANVGAPSAQALASR
jgi:hypothetical protein